MKLRPETYNTYWYFASTRQNIFYKRLEGKNRPWSDDPIFNTYKFCNTYRASDRVSQYLIRNVIYNNHYSEKDTIFRILLFKFFNKIETWQALEKNFGELTLSNFNYDHFASFLEKEIISGNKIYSNAYISCANKAFGYDRKHMNHLALIDKMVNTDNITSKITSSQTFENVFKILREYPLIGDFMAYQLATDINYSEVINFSENSFTVVGPGSKRGIAKCFENIGDKSPEYIIRYMQENQDQEFARLGLDFKNLFGRKLQLIDCQGLFCEVDKYSRAAFPELKSNRVRIKTKFTPTPKPIIPFYPPKWKLDLKAYL